MATTDVQPQEEQELQHHPTPRQYVRIGALLAAITALEVAIFYIESLSGIIVPALIALSLIKFVLVVSWFMHLRFDSRLFRHLFVTGLILALAVFAIVLTIFVTRGGALPEG